MLDELVVEELEAELVTSLDCVCGGRACLGAFVATKTKGEDTRSVAILKGSKRGALLVSLAKCNPGCTSQNYTNMHLE
jgi:hypothetical protein